ncbi:hypothetical protein EVJ58_g3802 [Rhodofomes roseus]|uniref:Uncharacterized protein n=1 Tax=Rhodofomes roseus TaxID=34475 RepID=A0A4Y9YKA7_9APHY|nr:hypothetical protein EVJ58_g3802 [Rhodofomes roseus]
MIIPLYNLQAHNVMQNVIVDAGTDAKIAKFMKRGLEVIGLAVLEPIEVWSGGSLDNDGRPRMSLDYAQGLLPPGSNTPTSSSAASLASESTHDPPAPVPIPAPVAAPASISSSSGRPGTPRKFFGKLFSGKKKDTSSVGGPTPPVTPTSPIPQLSMDPRVSKRSSLLSAHGHPVLPSVSLEFPLQPPVLGIQPTLRSPVVPPARPAVQALSPSRKNRTRSPGDGGPGGRRSMDSVRSVSPGPAASITTGESNTQENPEDDGEESDPEDSETPWTCTLVVRRLHPIVNPQTPTPRSPLADEPAQPQSLRVKVAAVVPTPHHPKVVALLKVPFPLPDVEIEHVAVRRRIVTPAGLSRPAPDAVPESAGSGSGQKKFWSASGKENGSGRAEAGRASGIVLTAEELKDVVSCTGLWLVVREGFGGVGKERRKGDGWRLRG